jgi:type II secretory pathway pseudopilin PulG
MTLRRRAFTMIEILVGFGIFLVLAGVAYGLLRFGIVSVGATVAPQVGLQMASRKAMVEFIKQIQECIEVARPLPGSTMTYFVARDKVNRIMTAYLVKNAADSTTAGKDIFDLYVHTKDFTPGKAPTNTKVLSNLERLTFTSLSPGLLQIHADLHEQGKTYALLTAVRTRNILAEGRL